MSNKPTVDGIPCNPQRTNQNGIYHVYFDRKDATLETSLATAQEEKAAAQEQAQTAAAEAAETAEILDIIVSGEEAEV